MNGRKCGPRPVTKRTSKKWCECGYHCRKDKDSHHEEGLHHKSTKGKKLPTKY